MTPLGAHIMARSYGAPLIDEPARPVWGLETVSGGHEGSALVEFDYGLVAPVENIPPDKEDDPHETPRRDEAGQNCRCTPSSRLVKSSSSVKGHAAIRSSADRDLLTAVTHGSTSSQTAGRGGSSWSAWTRCDRITWASWGTPAASRQRSMPSRETPSSLSGLGTCATNTAQLSLRDDGPMADPGTQAPTSAHCWEPRVQTAGFVANVRSLRARLRGGFDTWVLDNMATADAQVDAALAVAGAPRGDVFLSLHLMDPHIFYTPPEPFTDRFTDAVDRQGCRIDTTE